MVACANNYPLTILAEGTVCPDIVMPSVEITSGTVSVLEGKMKDQVPLQSPFRNP